MVREGGFEPPRPFGHWHLKPARLPFRHSRAPGKRNTQHDRPTNAHDQAKRAAPTLLREVA